MKKAFIMLSLTAAALISPQVHAQSVKEESFKKAAFSFGITEIEHNNNKISFTVPKDARNLDKKADAVVVSGLYDTARAEPTKCPFVDSTEVSKDIKNYDPFTGRARIIATFDDPAMAKAAYDTGCLLVNDPD